MGEANKGEGDSSEREAPRKEKVSESRQQLHIPLFTHTHTHTTIHTLSSETLFRTEPGGKLLPPPPIHTSKNYLRKGMHCDGVFIFYVFSYFT